MRSSSTLVATACLARLRPPRLCAAPPPYTIRAASFPSDTDALCDVRPPTETVLEDGAAG